MVRVLRGPRVSTVRILRPARGTNTSDMLTSTSPFESNADQLIKDFGRPSSSLQAMWIMFVRRPGLGSEFCVSLSRTMMFTTSAGSISRAVTVSPGSSGLEGKNRFWIAGWTERKYPFVQLISNWQVVLWCKAWESQTMAFYVIFKGLKFQTLTWYSNARCDYILILYSCVR